MARVLCIGIDSVLQETRKRLLEEGGHIVTLAMTEDEIRACCVRQSVNVAVIGQVSLPHMKESAFHIIRKYRPDARILELHDAHRQPELSGADDWLQVPSDVPQDLLVRVGRLVGLGERHP